MKIQWDNTCKHLEYYWPTVNAQYFVGLLSFFVFIQTSQQSYEISTIMIPIYRWGNWSSKSWSNLCKFTWWKSGRADFEPQSPRFSRLLLFWGVGMDLSLAPAGTWSSSTVLAKMSFCHPLLGAPSAWLMPHPHQREVSAISWHPSESLLLPAALDEMLDPERCANRTWILLTGLISLLNQHLDFLLYVYYSSYMSGINIYIINQMCQLHISLWNISWVPPETAAGVNHTFFPPCLGSGGAKL